MGQQKVMAIVEATSPELIDEILYMRRVEGKTVDAITSYVNQRLGTTLGRELIRMWFKDRDAKEAAKK